MAEASPERGMDEGTSVDHLWLVPGGRHNRAESFRVTARERPFPLKEAAFHRFAEPRGRLASHLHPWSRPPLTALRSSQ